MIDRLAVNFNETFVEAMLRGVDPKMQRINKDDPNSPEEQGKDKDGVLKWTVYLSVEVRPQFESKSSKKNFQDISVTITSPKEPCEGIPRGAVVTAEHLIAGIMSGGRAGFSMFFSADSIRPAQQPFAAGSPAGKLAATPSAQPRTPSA